MSILYSIIEIIDIVHMHVDMNYTLEIRLAFGPARADVLRGWRQIGSPKHLATARRPRCGCAMRTYETRVRPNISQRPMQGFPVMSSGVPSAVLTIIRFKNKWVQKTYLAFRTHFCPRPRHSRQTPGKLPANSRQTPETLVSIVFFNVLGPARSEQTWVPKSPPAFPANSRQTAGKRLVGTKVVPNSSPASTGVDT